MLKTSGSASTAAAQSTTTSVGGTAVLCVDVEGVVSRVSGQVAFLVGDADEYVGASLAALAQPAVGCELVDAVRRAATTSWSGEVGRHWLRADHRSDVLVDVFIDAASTDGQIMVILRDITADYVREQRSKGSAGFAQLLDASSVLDAAAMAVTRWTPDLHLDYHTPEFEALVLVEPELLLDAPMLDQVGFTDAANRQWSLALHEVLTHTQPVEFEWETGDHRDIRSRALLEHTADGTVSHVLVVSHDVTQERYRYEELTRRALQDPLTGLANRATALAHIERSLGRRGRSATSEAAIFIDLDRFKAMNDSLGHAAGDELLVAVARRLLGAVRPSDVVCRLGGDEFVVFLEQMSGIDGVLQVVDRLRAAVSAPLSLAGREIRVRTSMGIAFATAAHEDAESLLAKADAAMYKAKRAGRDRTEMYDDDLRRQVTQRMRSEQSLRRAMRTGELEAHLLPEFDLAAKKVVGAEALLRWRHPERGLVPAAEFIGMAEETGMLVQMGTEVLRRSCELVADWRRAGRLGDFTLRVNLSTKQLAQPTLAADVEDILDTTKLDPATLCLELAEATVTEQLGQSLRQLSQLRALGVKVSIDDFGTAASSLALLKELPVDMVKIDMSFVRGLGVDPRDSAIVKAIIDLGAALDLEVVAEGIDADHQLLELMQLGCRRGQGYGLSPVLAPSEFARRWL